MAIDITRLKQSSYLLESLNDRIDFSHFDYPLQTSEAANDDHDDEDKHDYDDVDN